MEALDLAGDGEDHTRVDNGEVDLSRSGGVSDINEQEETCEEGEEGVSEGSEEEAVDGTKQEGDQPSEEEDADQDPVDNVASGVGPGIGGEDGEDDHFKVGEGDDDPEVITVTREVIPAETVAERVCGVSPLAVGTDPLLHPFGPVLVKHFELSILGVVVEAELPSDVDEVDEDTENKLDTEDTEELTETRLSTRSKVDRFIGQTLVEDAEKEEGEETREAESSASCSEMVLESQFPVVKVRVGVFGAHLFGFFGTSRFIEVSDD